MKTIEQLKAGDKVYAFNTLSYRVEEYGIDNIECDKYGNYTLDTDYCLLPKFYCEDYGDFLKNEQYLPKAEDPICLWYFYADKDIAVKHANELCYKLIYELHDNIEYNNKLL